MDECVDDNDHQDDQCNVATMIFAVADQVHGDK